MGITNELKQTLKRLRLSGLLATLPDRVAYAKGTKLSYTEFLELTLNDEIQRREDSNVAKKPKLDVTPGPMIVKTGWGNAPEKRQ